MSWTGYDDSWQESLSVVLQALKDKRDEYDFIVCQGLSGTCLGFIAAYELKVPLLVLRKTPAEEYCKRNATARSGEQELLEGGNRLLEFKQRKRKKARVCFVDDCVSGGATRARCGAAVAAHEGVVTCQVTYSGFSKITPTRQKSFETASQTARYQRGYY